MRKGRTKSGKLPPLPKETVEHLREMMHHCRFPDFVAWKDKKDAPLPPYQSAAHKEQAFNEAVSHAHEAIAELKANTATCDRKAMDALVGIIGQLVDWLEEFSYRQESFVQSYARKSARWPVMASLHSQHAKWNRAYLKRLGVGTESEIATHEGKRWGIGRGGELSTATRYALAIEDTIQCNKLYVRHAKLWAEHEELRADWEKIPQWAKACLTLKPLTKDTAAKWFEIGWQAILEYTNDKPEDVPELRALGAYRTKHSEHTGQQKTVTPRTADVNIRAGIKERIEQALLSLATSR